MAVTPVDELADAAELVPALLMANLHADDNQSIVIVRQILSILEHPSDAALLVARYATRFITEFCQVIGVDPEGALQVGIDDAASGYIRETLG
jgi:hypothetical protein